MHLSLTRHNDKGQPVDQQPIALCNSWDTRIRTWNDRTRICSVTITPYPNSRHNPNLNCVCKVRRFFLMSQAYLDIFFYFTRKKHNALAVYPCSKAML